MNRQYFRYTVLAMLCATPVLSVQGADPFAELDAASSGPSTTTESDYEAFLKYKAQHQSEFEDYKKKLKEEFEAYKKIAQEETDKYRANLKTVWDEPELSSKKVWVDYSADMKTKNRVDFDKGVIQISTVEKADSKVDEQALRAKLKALLVKNQAQAFQDDKLAQAVETRTRQQLTLTESAEVKPKPILLPLVTEQEKPTEKEVDQIVDKMMVKKSESATKNKKGETVVTVEVPLQSLKAKAPETTKPIQAKKMADLRVNDLPRGARLVSDDVSKFASKSQLDHALVYAIIETESAFNPMAKSPIPAYGLMQIVPQSAGMDATQQLFGKGRILTPSYLYTSEKNIEIGTTYLNILYFRYLKGIKDERSRLYCSIAAYNTGAGNVAKAFIGTRKLSKALPKINSMTPDQVYDHLIKNLPYAETQHYLKKVTARIPKYST